MKKDNYNAIKRKFNYLLILAFLGFACSPQGQKAQEQNFEIVVKNGRVIDPETQLDAVRNLGIEKGKIVLITDSDISGQKTIDARGLVVAPGFIDLHAHGQTLTADRMQAFDGVTTALELESGILPIGPWYESMESKGRILNYGASAAWTFARIETMEEIPMEPDLRWFQSAFSLSKWVNDPADEKQIDNILRLIEEKGIKQGSIGIGINAGYAPGGGFKELMAVHALAATYEVPTFTHISGDFPSDPKSAAEYVGQIIAFSAATGSQDHICHLNSSSLRDVSTTRGMIIQAQKSGLPITTESYTYGASSTTIGAALFNKEGIERKNIKAEQIELNGKPLTEEEFQNIRKKNPGSVIVFRFLNMPQDESILEESVLFPGGSIASDAMPWVDITTDDLFDDNTWPLNENAFAHPRSAGTYSRLLSHYVRDRKALSLSEALAKSSLYPARILEKSVDQMKYKGRIQEGMDADIIVFDPETIQDRATFTEPYLTAEGMKYVLVNGTPVIEDGELVMEVRPGKAIRRDVEN
ncbi:amidohydrolase family protein [Pararhodonellum marinum]|uniref:amidohydrolase family protein n=1 Tax=Pararhodonellum marinum TaxID=2755358 RepID=UPI0018901C62|nr:amidohydrolase family protein [Pararhodonellum marinum]